VTGRRADVGTAGGQEGDKGGHLDGRTVIALGAMALGILVVANDFTALSVAVVDIERDLDTTLNRAQWVINAYTVVFGMLIVTGGRLADLFGRRRMFLTGAATFGTFSLLGGLAPSIELLITARALMGIGGALMWPSVLGMVYGILPKDKAGLAGGLIIGVAGFGNAMGPLLAGTLIELLSWRWVFFVNVPVALVAIASIRRLVPENRAGTEVGIDYRGIALLSSAVILLLVGLDVGTVEGFTSPAVLAMLALGLLLLAAFVPVERHVGAAALVPRRVMASRQFAASFASVVMMAAILFGALVYVPQITEKELGWSALQAGAGLLPQMLVFAVVSFVAGRLYNRIGARVAVGAGAACMTFGMFWLALAVGPRYGPLVPGLVLIGIGIGLYFSAITTAAVTAVDDEDDSLAGGIIYMGNIAGGSLGIGLNTAIVLSASSLTEGARNAFLVDAALGVVGTIVAVALIRGEASKPFHPLHRLHHRAHG
jgi:EmrB/QacA subfamily drug resistance transporter